MTNPKPLSPAAQAVLDAAKASYEQERNNFYKWLEICPLTNYRISVSNTRHVICEFHFTSLPPHIVAAKLEQA